VNYTVARTQLILPLKNLNDFKEQFSALPGIIGK
jgi:hypothetical protein